MFEDDLDPYRVLQVRPEADQEVLQAAYRALARRYHPDVADTAEARRAMVRINRAWELVNDPRRRRETDIRLRAADQADTTGHGGPAAATQARGPVTHDGSRPTAARPSNGWGAGAAGPPPGHPSGTRLEFGLYLGWTLGEVSRFDPGYLEWLAERPEGGPFLKEIQGLRRPAEPEPRKRRGFFGRG